MIIGRSFSGIMVRSVALLSALLLPCWAAFGQDAASPAQNAASPAPAATPPVTSAVTPEIKEFQTIEDKWSGAINDRDQYALELVLSPLFVDVAATGDVSTRNQQLATLIAADDKTLHLDQRVITVRLLGDIAVANGTYALHHKVATGVVDEKGVFTHVFERVHNNWLCINSQRTVLRADTAGGSNKQKKQPSNAELPFHIPLFSKN